MALSLKNDDTTETSLRYEFELDTIRAREEEHTSIESWVEKEKQRLWLGYFSIKI